MLVVDGLLGLAIHCQASHGVGLHWAARRSRDQLDVEMERPGSLDAIVNLKIDPAAANDWREIP